MNVRSTHRSAPRAAALSAVAATIAVGGAVLPGSPASADCNGGSRNHHVHSSRNEFGYGGHGSATNIGNNRERWCDFSTEEGWFGVWPTTIYQHVCNYQGAMHVYHPDGTWTERFDESRRHQGCSWSGWMYHDSLDGEYSENKRFRAKWRSDGTGQEWKPMGFLID
jgi:hypothetical protein